MHATPQVFAEQSANCICQRAFVCSESVFVCSESVFLFRGRNHGADWRQDGEGRALLRLRLPIHAPGAAPVRALLEGLAHRAAAAALLPRRRDAGYRQPAARCAEESEQSKASRKTKRAEQSAWNKASRAKRADQSNQPPARVEMWCWRGGVGRAPCERECAADAT